MRPAVSSSSPPSVSDSSDSQAIALTEVPKMKIVVRGLPPSLSEREFKDTVIPLFEKYFEWISFCPGKVSMRRSRTARAYLYFIHPEDVIKFYEHYNGHVFVSERGMQYKALVHYAPHQKVPKPSFKDNEEGSILADPAYSEFISGLAKPVELLPSAEVQLERREAEKRAGFVKETIIVTPLMQYVRENRKAILASKKRTSGPRNSNILPKGVPDISRDYFKYASKTTRPFEKLSYTPLYKVPDCKDTVTHTKRKTISEAKGGLVARERGLGINREEEQKIEKHLGSSKHAVGQSARKVFKSQTEDVGRRLKHKQIWVAKPASGTQGGSSVCKYC